MNINEVKKLWHRDKAANIHRPSLDREDEDKDYTFDNCRFIPLSENSSFRRKQKEFLRRNPELQGAEEHSRQASYETDQDFEVPFV